MKTKFAETKYCIIWSYDNFTFNYEENEKEYETIQEVFKEYLDEVNTNKEFMKDKNIQEPKCYFRIRRKQIFADEPNTEYVTDYNVRKYRNRYHLSRAEDIV